MWMVSFVLELPKETTLVFSYIGYRSREIEYEGQLFLNVQLEDDTRILDEVVVTALGIEKKGIFFTLCHSIDLWRGISKDQGF